MKPEVADTDIVAPPEYFIGIVHDHILYIDDVHFTEHLGRIYYGVLHFQMVGIPQCRTSADSEITVAYREAMDMPERVIALETTIRGYYVAALLYGRFSFTYDDTVKMQVMRGEKRPFAAEFFVFDQLHILSL